MASSRKSDTDAETVALLSSDEASSTSFELASSCAGLDNLSNTCYMNSSIVCLANVPEFRDYFLSNSYKDSLEVNGKLTERTNGEFAQEFHSLLSDLWNNSYKSFKPRRFKDMVGRLEERFHGYDQHDAMEFLEFTIDTLREDCNRVKGKKPYMERKEDPDLSDIEVARDDANYQLMRNDSYLDDLFVGFTKRTTLCPHCQKKTFLFDPILSVKLPLTGSCDATYHRRLEFSVVALNRRMVTRHVVTLDKRGRVSDLKFEASRIARLDISKCMLVDVSKNTLACLRDDAKLTTIRAVDKLVLYEFTAKDAKVISRLDPQGFVENVQIKDTIVVAHAFLSVNERDSRELHMGMRGVIIHIDDDGDANVKFDGIDHNQWVHRHHFRYLLKLNSERKKICPKRNKAYSLVEVATWREFGNDFRHIRDYWMYQMEDAEDSSHTACMIYFRKVLTNTNGASNSSFMGRCGFCASRAGRQGELVGFPFLLGARRDTTATTMRKLVGSELLHRFGIDCTSGWSLYHASCGKDALNANLVVPSGETVLHLGEIEHFVVQLGPAYGEVCRDFEEIARVKLKENIIPIQTCFEWLQATEELAGDNKIHCSGCKTMQNVLTKTEIWSLPPVLVVHLKRFEYDNYYNNYRKSDRGVSFPLEGLDLSGYSRGFTSFPEGECTRAGKEVEIVGLESDAGKMLNGQRGTAMFLDTATTPTRFCVRLKEKGKKENLKKVQPKNLKPVSPEVKPDLKPWTYDLVSLAKHVGRPGFGHYVAYARSSEDGLWRLYDDDDVREVQPETVEAEHSGCYVLVYLRRDLRPTAWGPPGKVH